MRLVNRSPTLPTEFGSERYRLMLQEILREHGQSAHELVQATTGWRDLMGRPQIRATGSNDPSFNVFLTNIRLYQFSQVNGNELWFEYHFDHDVAVNPEVHIHVHWAQATVDSGGAASAPGVVKWYFDMTYAKGHNQAAFPATIQASVTQTASSTQYQHMIAEVQIASTSPTASQFDSAIIEPDGILLVRLARDPGDPADTLNQGPFVINCDCHYQVDHYATPFKSPPFK